MIYFDNAATTWPKPPEVWQAMEECIRQKGANPGRAGHQMAISAGKVVDEARELLASLFNIKNPDRIVFTLNATEALNLAIKGLLKKGEHIITSSMEHNSVVRPLNTMANNGVEVTKVSCANDGSIKLEDIKASIKSNTVAIVITHASNVSGTIMPISEIGQLAKRKGLSLIVDAAQTSGFLDIDVSFMGIHLLAFPGHKGLYGPTGTGGLYIADGINLKPLKEGGTGSHSDLPGQPAHLPERYESGTLNSVGIAGLAAGVKFVRKEGLNEIRKHEMELTECFLKGIMGIKDILVYGPDKIYNRTPVISFCIKGKDSSRVAMLLDQDYKIACRSGLHCAPDAHKTLGTFDKKLVRFSFSFYNTIQEINYGINSLDKISSMSEKEFLNQTASGDCGC